MVDDQLGGLERVDLFGVAAEGAHGVAHGGEIDDGGDAGEVLHEDAGGHVGDLAGGLGLGVPGGEELDVVRGDGAAVFVAEEVFEQDAEGEGQAGEVEFACSARALRRKRLTVVVPVVRVAADLKESGCWSHIFSPVAREGAM